jgi:hypothetical protein
MSISIGKKKKVGSHARFIFVLPTCWRIWEFGMIPAKKKKSNRFWGQPKKKEKKETSC